MGKGGDVQAGHVDVVLPLLRSRVAYLKTRMAQSATAMAEESRWRSENLGRPDPNAH